MAASSYVKLVNLNHLNTDIVAAMIKFYHRLESGAILPGAWSRIVKATIPRTNPKITQLVNQVYSWILPKEQMVWQHFPQLTDIEIYHMDAMRYGRGTDWGLAVNYYRLDQSGAPIVGWEGDTLFQVRNGVVTWAGGVTDDVEEGLSALGVAILNWAEEYVDQNVLGGGV